MLYVCQKIIVSCFLDSDTQNDVRETFLAINQSDSGEITADELRNALPDLNEAEINDILFNSCQEYGNEDPNDSETSYRQTIKWSEFRVACSQIVQKESEEDNYEFDLYMQKVFGYLNVQN